MTLKTQDLKLTNSVTQFCISICSHVHVVIEEFLRNESWKGLNDAERTVLAGQLLPLKTESHRKCVIKAHSTKRWLYDVDYYCDCSVIDSYYYTSSQGSSSCTVHSAADTLIWEHELPRWLWHHGGP